MSAAKIERRHIVVPLVDGATRARLDEMEEAVLKAEQAYKGQQRHSTKNQAVKLAQQWEAFRAEAEAAAQKVTVWAIGRRDWQMLADEHPPRDGDDPGAEVDKFQGVNMKTFPEAVAALSLLEPGEMGSGFEREDFEKRLRAGNERADALDLAHRPWQRVVQAAWEVNTGDDALPKYSLVSLLQEQRERASKPPPASESALPSSTDMPARKSTSTTPQTES